MPQDIPDYNRLADELERFLHEKLETYGATDIDDGIYVTGFLLGVTLTGGDDFPASMAVFTAPNQNIFLSRGIAFELLEAT